MDAPAETRLVTIRFYVRPTRTLVTAVVHAGVGGRRSPLFRSGGRMALGSPDIAEIAPEALPVTLAHAFVSPESVIPMSREAYLAWQRGWRPGGP
jgi:hypothetical protein